MKLFEDQKKIINEVMLNLNKNNLVVSPSGSGKTYMISQITKNLTIKNKNVIIIVPTNVVQEQTLNLLEKFQVNVPVGSSLYFYNNNEISSVDYIIIDEAHHSEASVHQLLFKKFPKAKRIGFTATPVRLDKKELSNSYNNIIQGLSVKELIKMNRLSPFKYYAPNLKGSSIPEIFNSDFLEIEDNQYKIEAKHGLYKKENKGKIFGDVIKTYQEFSKNKPAILFAQSIKQSKEFASAFNKLGITSEHIDGYMTQEARKQILNRFKKGQIKVICNFSLISEGFDMSDCETVILVRKTTSLSLYLQQVFRALRYKPNKKAIILDHANNVRYHNQIDLERYWSLDNNNEEENSASTRLNAWKKGPINYIFDTSIKLEDITTVKNPEFEEKVKSALLKDGFDSFKDLVKIQSEYNIISNGKKSWAYTIATHYNKINLEEEKLEKIH